MFTSQPLSHNSDFFIVLISTITPEIWGIIGLISTIILFRPLNSRCIIRLLGRRNHVRWKDMICKKCKDLRVKFEIKHPYQLKQAIKIAKQNVADNTISNVPISEESYWVPFDELKEEGPWDDIVGYEFICNNCGTVFSLSCDTYHGNGRWNYKISEGQ